MFSHPETLLLIDLQNDFCPGGALAVNNGDRVIPFANYLIGEHKHVIASKDWHPEKHKSFASTNGKNPGDMIQLMGSPQIMWPDHCVQNTPGAEFHNNLDASRINKIILKGTDINVDSYSTFFDNNRIHQTELYAYLKEKGIKDISMMGLATDYCVKFSALDALELGINVSLFLPGCRGIDLNPGDVQGAVDHIRQHGGKIIDFRDI